MASINPLPSGKWNVRIRRQGYPLVTKTFTTQKDAQRWARTTESEMDRGVFLSRDTAEATTLGQALTRYLFEVTPDKKGAGPESRRISRWLKHPLSKRSLASLKPMDFVIYRDERLSSGLSPNTVRHELGIISHLFGIAHKEWGFAVSPIIESIRMPKPGKARSRRLVGDEYERLLKACTESSNHFLAPLFVLAIETGMRLSEMLGMKYGDIDKQARTVILHDTKNGERRVVPLTTKAMHTIQELPRSIKSDRVFYVWGQRSDAVKGSWNRALKRAGIEDLHFHDLRHEAISRLFELGLNPFEVAAVSGHKSMQMLKRYTHLRPADLLLKMEGLGSSPCGAL